MWKKFVVIGGIVAAAGLGIGGVALAESNSAPVAAAATSTAASSSPATSAPATSSTATKAPGGKAPAKASKADRVARREALAKRLLKVEHAQWVSKDAKTGGFVTHDAIRGTVSAVSSTAITVRSTDGTSETFAVNSSTKVRVKGDGKSSTIAQVKVGDHVGVLGTGTGPMTATHVIDRGVPAG